MIRTRQGQTFVGAYWREQGSYVQQALDIFAVDTTPKGPVARQVYTAGLGGDVLALHVLDLDGDGRDDFLLIHQTGGMIAATGVTVLRQTPVGFSEVFQTAGSDAVVYREGDQIRLMIKGKTSKKLWEYAWSPSKGTFEVARTLELLY